MSESLTFPLAVEGVLSTTNAVPRDVIVSGLAVETRPEPQPDPWVVERVVELVVVRQVVGVGLVLRAVGEVCVAEQRGGDVKAIVHVANVCAEPEGPRN